MKRIAQSAITTGSGTLLYTVPTGFKCEVKDICIANTTTGAIACKLYLVPVGGSASASNMLFPNVSIPANTVVQWTGSQQMNTGDFIQGIGASAGLTVTVTGDEYR